MIRRRYFKPLCLRQAPPGQAASAVVVAAPPAERALQPLAIFDCTFWPQHKKKGAAANGTLVVRGRMGQLLDLTLREKAAATLPARTAATLHGAHAAALASAALLSPFSSCK